MTTETTVCGGGAILELESATSTNSFLVDSRRHGQPYRAVYTMNQTEGRGRSGRGWIGRPGETLAFSFVCDEPEDNVSLTWMPLLAGAVLCEVLRNVVGEKIAVKWPNDVLVGDKKLAGILVEAIPQVGVIVGVGVNLHSTALSLPHPQATSVAVLGGQVRDPRSEVILPFLNLLDEHLRDASYLTDDGKIARYRQLVMRHLGTVGKEVRFTAAGGQSEEAVAVGLGKDGALLVCRRGDENLLPIHSGDVFEIARS
jgi:BirA family biotin operon repressor/biotin-[acetyl-CoA-carboxylase] ligase